MLEKYSTISTDVRTQPEWYVTDEINELGIQVGTDQKEPCKIPPGTYRLVGKMVGEFDPEICSPFFGEELIIK